MAQPIHYCAQYGYLKIFNMLCDQYGVSPLLANGVSYSYGNCICLCLKVDIVHTYAAVSYL